jgi:hypothetical protein
MRKSNRNREKVAKNASSPSEVNKGARTEAVDESMALFVHSKV